jgi:hypothetical protein
VKHGGDKKILREESIIVKVNLITLGTPVVVESVQ